MVVIEMNPRVSRSSALASKATGFPIAKIAAKLAVGYRLHELPNDITRKTPACFEPTIDYVVTKIPRFAFEKFPEADPTLTTQMKSVGETMAIGRTFKESFQKALRGLEVGSFGFGCDGKDLWGTARSSRPDEKSAEARHVPNDQRVWHLRYAIKYGMSLDEIHELTGIDPWFLDNLFELVEMEDDPPRPAGLGDRRRPCSAAPSSSASPTASLATSGNTTRWRSAPSASAAASCPRSSRSIPAPPSSRPTRPTTTRPTRTRTRRPPKQAGKRRIMILGGGPNRIGQGIEFDYCCCHASFALRELGIESVMVNSNPETVSTDYDTSDLLFFEPLTTEDVLNICDRVEPDGVIVQFGGQTPLNLARGAGNAGVPIIGTSVDTIEDAEDREKFAAPSAKSWALKQPANGIARNMSRPGRGGQGRLPRPGAAQLRARRPGHGDLLRRGPVRAVRGRGVRSWPRASRCSSTASSKTPSRWTSTPSPTASA
jgi:carbamoyl-phosphate synthase large subunit